MHEFHPPPKTISGTEAVSELPDILAERGWDDVLFVTDEGVSDAGVLDQVRQQIPGDGRVFDTVEPNPSVETVNRLPTATDGADVVVAVGGGSVMDAAKAATALPAFDSGTADGTAFDSLLDRLIDWPVDEQAPQPDAAIPLILIPTTAGTGSETGHWAVISDHGQHEKLSVGHPTVGGELVVLDPTLTTTLPPYVTAASGFDVIVHAVEALVASGASQLTQPYARAGYDLAVERLPVAIQRGEDLSVRADLLSASYMAGLAMNNAGLGAVHAISHAIGGHYDTPHGHTNALIVPEVVRRNATGSQSAFATYADLAGDVETPGETLALRLDTLRRSVGLENDLPGLPDDPDWDSIADLAVGNINMETNPVTFSRETVLEICRAVFE